MTVSYLLHTFLYFKKYYDCNLLTMDGKKQVDVQCALNTVTLLLSSKLNFQNRSLLNLFT